MAGKHIFIVCAITYLIFLNSAAFAYSTKWTSAAGDGDWCNPDNWTCMDDPHPLTCVPDCDWQAFIQPPLPGPTVTDGPCWWGSGSCCDGLYVHPWSWGYAPDTEMNISLSTGTFDCGHIIGISIHGASNGHGTINMFSGTVLTSLAAGDTDGLEIGWMPPAYGVLNVYGGLITVPRIAVYYGVINLYGGVLKNTSFVSANFFISDLYAMNKINLAGGTLSLAGDRRDEIYIATRIIPYENRGRLIVDYDESSPGDTTVTAVCDLGLAYNPNPAHSQSKVSLTPILSWTPGDYVQSVNEHQVYFGTSFADVNNADVGNPLGVYKGVRDVNNFSPEGPLDTNTTYYWRIDEVNDANTDSPWKGNVWRFTTTPCPVGGSDFPGNFNDDCIVDLFDLKIFTQEWLTVGVLADIYPEPPDGIVDFSDFAVLAENWLVEQF